VRIARTIGIGTLIVVALVTGAATYFFQHHRRSIVISPEGAEREFLALRARFSTQQPVLDMDRREAAPLTPGSIAAPLRKFHTVIFDTRGGDRLVHIDVPYWLARRFAGADREFKWLGELTFLDDTEFDPESIRLSLDAIERRGPGLVAYHRHPGGGQFISWVE
jgi:hypothetical protein